MPAFIRPTPKIPAARETKPLVPRVRIRMNSRNWPAPDNVWVFIAQLVEYCSTNAKTMGSNTVEFPTFFGLICNCLKCNSHYDDRIFTETSSHYGLPLKTALKTKAYLHFLLLPVQRQIFPPKLSSICCLVGLGFSFNKLKQK